MTSFGSHCRNTDRSLKVSITSYRYRSDPVQCGNGSGETIVVEEEQNKVVVGGHDGSSNSSVIQKKVTSYSSAHFDNIWNLDLR